MSCGPLSVKDDEAYNWRKQVRRLVTAGILVFLMGKEVKAGIMI